jgi:ferredoxin
LKPTYKIGDECIICSTCVMLCPAECISFGYEHYEIDQTECIHCGTCAQNCPVGTIRKQEE